MSCREMTAAAIHDLSGVGKCSLTVVLPVLSACGVETAALPTAFLSTHTGGFQGFTYTDLTDTMLPAVRHWKEVGCHFSSVYTGFLGSAAQIGIVEEIFTLLREKDTLIFCDPVMGDNGKLYQTYTKEMADGMVRLCRKADVVVPNLTEACYMLGLPYGEGPYEKGFIQEVLEGLLALGPRLAVLTGVWLEEGALGCACLGTGMSQPSYVLMERVQGYFHGTGDLFASALLGCLLNGMTPQRACETATEFTLRSIRTTKEQSRDYRFGPKFEGHLAWLAEKCCKDRDFGIK